MKNNRKTANDWLTDVLKEVVHGSDPDEVPEGWMSLKDMSDQKKMPESTIRSIMMKLIKRGIVERRKFRISTGVGISPVYHYIKKQK